MLSKTNYAARANRRYHRLAPEIFPVIYVGTVDFNARNVNRGYRIPNGNAVVCIRPGVDYYSVNLFPGLLDRINDLPLAVRLKHLAFKPNLLSAERYLLVYRRYVFLSVNRRLANPQQINIRTMYNQDFLFANSIFQKNPPCKKSQNILAIYKNFYIYSSSSAHLPPGFLKTHI